MVIKKGDFIELDFVGRLQGSKQIFDLTDAACAKKENVYNAKTAYGPKIICVGEQQIVKGIDNFLMGKELSTYTVAVPPESGFGKKDPRLMKLVPAAVFHQQKIAPFPCLQVTINNTLGTVRTVSGGRIIVDFNHPLAGRNLEYEIVIKRIVTQTEEKLESYVANLFNKPVSCAYNAGKATMTLDLPEQFQKTLIEHIKKVIPEIKEIVFQSDNKPGQPAEKKTATQV